MRIAVIGRTQMLLDAARLAHRQGHRIAAIWTCPAESHYGTKASEFAAFADEAGAVFREDRRINAPDAVRLLREQGCDVALSVNWPTVLGPAVRGAFRLGILNAHAGDLPRYRGNACPNWAILRGEPQIGLCVHLMTDELDAGPVVLRDRHRLADETYVGDLYRWIEARTPPMLVEAATGLATGRLQPVPQDESGVLRTFPRRPEDGRLNWSAPAETVLRLVRASSRPFAGAFTTLEGTRRVTIWRACRLSPAGEFAAVPGQVCFAVAGDPVVAAADGLLRLQEIELEGGVADAEAKRTVLRSLRNRLM